MIQSFDRSHVGSGELGISVDFVAKFGQNVGVKVRKNRLNFDCLETTSEGVGRVEPF